MSSLHEIAALPVVQSSSTQRDDSAEKAAAWLACDLVALTTVTVDANSQEPMAGVVRTGILRV